MVSRRDEQFPVEAVRDLLGIVRVIYRATPTTESVKRAKVKAIGESLKIAIELSVSSVGSLGHRAAWERAEKACLDLSDCVGPFERAEPLLRAAGAAVKRRR